MQKQQHYIPKCYSKFFANPDGYVYLRDMWLNKVFPIRPIDALKQGYIYTQPVHAERRFDNALENLFSRTVESSWPLIVAQIKSKKNLDDKTWQQVIEFMLSMRIRVPNLLKAVTWALREMAISVSDEIPLQESLAKLFYKQQPTFERTPVFSDLVSEGLVSVNIDPHRALLSLDKLVRNNKAILSIKGGPKFLHNMTRLDFISSDNPFISHIFQRDISRLKPYSYAFEKNIEIVFPITPRICLLLNPRNSTHTQHYDTYDETTVSRINNYISMYSDRYILGGSQDSLCKISNFCEYCPIPEPRKSTIISGLVHDIEFSFGEPIKFRNKWKYDFE